MAIDTNGAKKGNGRQALPPRRRLVILLGWDVMGVFDEDGGVLFGFEVLGRLFLVEAFHMVVEKEIIGLVAVPHRIPPERA